MPYPEQDYRFQRAVLWRYIGDDEYGNPVVQEGIDITVRWEDKQIQIIGPNGQPMSLDATVESIKEIPINSILWKGSTSSISTIDEITGFMQVVTQDKTPDVKARVFRLTYGLKRYNEEFPEIQVDV